MPSNDNYLDKEMLALRNEIEAKRLNRQRLIQIGEALHLPLTYDDNNAPAVLIEVLWGILSDETSRRELLSRLNLKAFW
jgi:hypothetical protein